MTTTTHYGKAKVESGTQCEHCGARDQWARTEDGKHCTACGLMPGVISADEARDLTDADLAYMLAEARRREYRVKERQVLEAEYDRRYPNA